MAGEFNLIENFAVPFLSEWSKNNIGLLLDHEMNWNMHKNGKKSENCIRWPQCRKSFKIVLQAGIKCSTAFP